MSQRNIPQLRKKFMKIYGHLPSIAKNCTIIFIKNKETNSDEPYSWHVVKLEVKGKTKVGRQMLKQLEGMGLL